MDPTNAVIPGASVTLTNTDTGVSQIATTGPQGDFRFVSVAPGPYEVTTSAKGFASHKVPIRLQTEQTLNLPFTLSLSGQSQTVEVTDRAPVLDTVETRNPWRYSTCSTARALDPPTEALPARRLASQRASTTLASCS